MTAPIDARDARILIIGGDAHITDRLPASLKSQGFEVVVTRTGKEALDCALASPPDAVILDVAMPGMDGLGILKLLRTAGCRASVLFLTAKHSITNKVTGLTLGDDDFVSKPFSVEEITARLRTILRRSGRLPSCRPARVTFADIELDDDKREVLKAGMHVDLSPTEFTLLRYFMTNAGTVLSKARILDHVWNYDFVGEARVVESYVSYLRRKLDDSERSLIHTIRGVGYVMRGPRS